MKKAKTKKLFLDELNQPQPAVQAAAASLFKAWSKRVAERIAKQK